MTLDKFPDADPSITLDFQKSKKLDPRITFTRASDATTTPPTVGEGSGNVGGQVYEFQENVPRLTSQGLLIEQSRTNQLPYSEDYSNWNLWNTTTAPLVNETAPDGSTTCRKLTEGTTNAFTLMGEGSNMVNSTNYTFSFYIKKSGARFCLVRTQANSSPEICTFDMDTLDDKGKPTVNNPSTPVATNIDFDVLSNGWFRFYCTFPCNDAGTDREVQIGINETNSVSLETYTGDGTSGFLIWGAQLEVGTFPTSYIPTSGAEVTRAPDICFINGANLNGWYNNSQGTFLLHVLGLYNQPNNSDRTFFISTDGGNTMLGSNLFSNSYRDIRCNNLNVEVVAIATLPANNSLNEADLKMAWAYTEGDPELVVNIPGTTTTESSSTSATAYPAILQIGSDPRGTTNPNPLNGYLASFTFYPTRLPDDALVSLTTQQT